MQEVKLKIEDEMNSLMDALKETDPSSEEYKAAAANCEKLKDIYRGLSDEERQVQNHNFEKGRYVIDNVIGIAKFAIDTSVKVGSIIFAAKMYNKWWGEGMEFEKTGNFTSPTFKNLTKRFDPFKLF